MWREGSLSSLDAQEGLEAVAHQPLKMKNVCSGVGSYNDMQSTEGASDCLEEEGQRGQY